MGAARHWVALLILLGTAWPAMAAKPLSIDQMEQLLVTLHGKPDSKVAAEVDDVQLTERVNAARLARWETEFPGPKAHQGLMKLADLSAFLDPPASDVVVNPRPGAETQKQILRVAVEYVATTMTRLPDFFATRETTHFEAASSQPDLNTAMNTEVGLHWIGNYSRTVTYRDGQETRFEGAGKQDKNPPLGLVSEGEFGPMLLLTVRDALTERIGFVRWERAAGGPAAVFAYAVPESASHFRVETTVGGQVQTLHPAYRGEIEVDPETGAILRISEVAEMAPPHQKERAAIAVEYAPVTIGDRSYICPVKGIALSKIQVPPAGMAGDRYGPAQLDRSLWPLQTDLNNVAFSHYHEFRSEARIIANPSEDNGGNAASGTTPEENSAGTEALGPNPAAAAAAAVSAAPDTETVTSSSNAAPAAGSSSDATVTALAPRIAAKPETETAENAAPPPPASATANAPAGSPAFRAKSQLVLVDVVVTNHDDPMKGLDRDRFHVFEDGRELPIASFEENQPPPSVEMAELQALPEHTYSNLPLYPETNSVNVLLLDALNTPASDQERVRRTMIAFLSTIKPGTPMAVFTLSSQLRMVAGFTTDVAPLIKVLESPKANPQSGAGVGSGRSSEMSTDLQQVASSTNTGNDPGTIWLANLIMGSAAETKAYNISQRAAMTFEAFNELAQYLSAIPGRKNVIWFSGSFPIDLGSSAMAPLAAARVAVYPVDARGLMNAPTAGAAYVPTPTKLNPSDPFTQNLDRTGIGAIKQDNAVFAAQTFQEKNLMNTIATETGGQVYSTGNDLKAAVNKITANDSYYYTLSYVPPETRESKNAPEYHTVEVKVDGGNYQLAYRRGYYSGVGSASGPGGESSPMAAAAEAGALPATQILFRARVLPASAPELNGAALDDNAAGEKTTSFPGGAHRYVVDLNLKPQDLPLAEDADGKRHTELVCELLAYDDKGQLVNSLGRAVKFSLTPEQYHQLTASGGAIPERLALDLPAGEIGLRIVLFNPTTAKAGSLEIPLDVPAAK